MRKLYGAVTGSNGIESLQVSTAHNAATAVGVATVRSTSLSIGSAMEIDLGYEDEHNVVFRGYVKQVDRNSNTGFTTVTAQDELSRAVDFYIASSSPNNPFKRKNIPAEFLVRDILSLAGITNYTYQPTSFIFAPNHDLEVNLIGAYDFCKQIADILAWHIYADFSGQVHFVDRKPYITGGDSASKFIVDQNILSSNLGASDSDLRNRIVVYGKGDISATAQASSPYLPGGFFKTTVLATEIIQTTSSAQQAANFNLALLNRLREGVTINIEGRSDIFARDIVNLNDSILGVNEDFYAYAVEHSWGKDGYTTSLVLRK